MGYRNMGKKLSILCMVVICAFLTAGCSSSKKIIPEEKSAEGVPSQLEQKDRTAAENDPADEAGEVKNEEKSQEKTAYITVDDGPSRNNTVSILDTLKKNGIKATFFVLPKANMDGIYRRIINEGHVLGNHSYSHARCIYGSAEDFEKDLLKAKAFIYEKFDYTTTVFRFPGGTKGRKKSIIQKRAEILKRNGYRYFDWDVSVADTDPNLKNYGDEKAVINLMVKNVGNNTKGKKQLIVLMHDSSGKTCTARALPHIIKELQKQGYIFDVLTNYKE